MTPPGSYAKGVRGEKKTRKWLEAQGYTVIEARGSHGAVDLVGTHMYTVVFVQVKSGRVPSKSEFAEARSRLRDVPIPKACARWLVHWPDYSREPSVEVVE